MKIYLKANSDTKPPLPEIEPFWGETEYGESIWFVIINPEDSEYLFNKEYNYRDYDPDSIYNVATEEAIEHLSKYYTLSDADIDAIRNISTSDA